MGFDAFTVAFAGILRGFRQLLIRQILSRTFHEAWPAEWSHMSQTLAKRNMGVRRGTLEKWKTENLEWVSCKTTGSKGDFWILWEALLRRQAEALAFARLLGGGNCALPPPPDAR